MTETVSTEAVLQTISATDSSEDQLVTEVGNLWQIHNHAQSLLTKSRAEMKLIRADLSQRLHQLKAALSKPGRAGAWSSFLAAQKIPRSTADRLARAHDRKLSLSGNNCPSEQIDHPFHPLKQTHRSFKAHAGALLQKTILVDG
ncbi:MAG: hypothetical protein WCE63_00595 [Acidobacteriaceae bacterium]